MPLYVYECGACHSRFEKKQGFDEAPITMCPKCQCMAQRVIYPSPVIFKGSGFYLTDHRKGSDTLGKEEGKKEEEKRE